MPPTLNHFWAALPETLQAILKLNDFGFFYDPVVLAGLLRLGFELIFSLNHSVPILFTRCSEMEPLMVKIQNCPDFDPLSSAAAQSTFVWVRRCETNTVPGLCC